MTLTAAKLANIQPHFQRYIEQGKLVGLTTLVASQGEIVHFEQYGSQNSAQQLPRRLTPFIAFIV